jgi:hypothetical protein
MKFGTFLKLKIAYIQIYLQFFFETLKSIFKF